MLFVFVGHLLHNCHIYLYFLDIDVNYNYNYNYNVRLGLKLSLLGPLCRLEIKAKLFVAKKIVFS